ncbi:MAG: hypothetical protein QG553_36 [Patescibacteria group bacterium]|nr:hypothetical protein [Patescibacteria group bacterium]
MAGVTGLSTGMVSVIGDVSADDGAEKLSVGVVAGELSNDGVSSGAGVSVLVTFIGVPLSTGVSVGGGVVVGTGSLVGSCGGIV